jgi:hypothetical protein
MTVATVKKLLKSRIVILEPIGTYRPSGSLIDIFTRVARGTAISKVFLSTDCIYRLKIKKNY